MSCSFLRKSRRDGFGRISTCVLVQQQRKAGRHVGGVSETYFRVRQGSHDTGGRLRFSTLRKALSMMNEVNINK